VFAPIEAGLPASQQTGIIQELLPFPLVSLPAFGGQALSFRPSLFASVRPASRFNPLHDIGVGQDAIIDGDFVDGAVALFASARRRGADLERQTNRLGVEPAAAVRP